MCDKESATAPARRSGHLRGDDIAIKWKCGCSQRGSSAAHSGFLGRSLSEWRVKVDESVSH